jgi:hypothetical protein
MESIDTEHLGVWYQCVPLGPWVQEPVTTWSAPKDLLEENSSKVNWSVVL